MNSCEPHLPFTSEGCVFVCVGEGAPYCLSLTLYRLSGGDKQRVDKSEGQRLRRGDVEMEETEGRLKTRGDLLQRGDKRNEGVREDRETAQGYKGIRRRKRKRRCVRVLS